MEDSQIQQFQAILATSDKIALSTALNNQADVKIVNFVWFKEQPDILYFSSVRGTAALETYSSADCALITIPVQGTPGNPYVRARHVTISPSTKSMAQDLLPRYLETVPDYQAVWDAIGPTLVPFEIHLDAILVDPGIGTESFRLQF